VIYTTEDWEKYQRNETKTLSYEMTAVQLIIHYVMVTIYVIILFGNSALNNTFLGYKQLSGTTT